MRTDIKQCSVSWVLWEKAILFLELCSRTGLWKRQNEVRLWGAGLKVEKLFLREVLETIQRLRGMVHYLPLGLTGDPWCQVRSKRRCRKSLAGKWSAAVWQEVGQHTGELLVRVFTTVVNGIDHILEVSVGLKAMGCTYLKQATYV